MLSEDQILAVAKKINKKVNLPIVGERFEEKIIVKALKKVDAELDEHLPGEFSELLDSLTDGLEPGSANDLEQFKDNLVSYLNKKIDLPILGEKGERKLFEIAIDIIVDAMRKGDKL